jgi:hypothetical protein
MKNKNNYFVWEDKLKQWFIQNRFKWCLILFCLGVGLSFLQNSLLGASVKQYFNNGLLYGCLLVTIELSVGGSDNSGLE